MNVASQELCKELYEVSGWEDTYTTHILSGKDVDYDINRSATMGSLLYPAYDLGYLVRKLPLTIEFDNEKWEEVYGRSLPSYFFMARDLDTMDNKWRVQYQGEDQEDVIEDTMFDADTPEDATAKLCIELFKQGILKGGVDE